MKPFLKIRAYSPKGNGLFCFQKEAKGVKYASDCIT
jgi:hypothetical protein